MSSIIGGVIGAIGSNKAGKQQAKAAQNASQMQMDMFNQVRGDLQPYMNMGASQIDDMLVAARDPRLTTPFKFSAAGLANTPGYQFARNQGLKAMQNSSASKGLGLSGAQLRGAGEYATGLADQTYGNQFGRALQGWQSNLGAAQNRFNNLMGIVGSGQNAAAGVGQMGMNAAGAAGQFSSNAGAARAAGTMGMTNAATGAISDMQAMATMGMGGGGMHNVQTTGGLPWAQQGTQFARGGIY